MLILDACTCQCEGAGERSWFAGLSWYEGNRPSKWEGTEKKQFLTFAFAEVDYHSQESNLLFVLKSGKNML